MKVYEIYIYIGLCGTVRVSQSATNSTNELEYVGKKREREYACVLRWIARGIRWKTKTTRTKTQTYKGAQYCKSEG